MSRPNSQRREMVSQIEAALRRQSGLTVLFHQAIAERLGLHASDHKCLDILMRSGRVSAGALAVQTGLTTGAITGVIDRLEQAGYARRVADPNDRRRIIVEPVVERAMAEVGPLFRDIAAATGELCARFNDRQLRDILEFIVGCEAVLREQTSRLQRVTADSSPPTPPRRRKPAKP